MISTSQSQPLPPPQAQVVYGPVYSWRFGQSVGVDLLLVDSICSFRCVYCQLGRIHNVTRQRGLYVPTTRLIEEIEARSWEGIDALTFSGSGEPTLARNLGEALDAVRERIGTRTVVLTNGTTLDDPEVQEELSRADHVSLKLDAATEALLHRLNRPAPGIELDSLVRNMAAFRSRFEGALSIQIMLLPANREYVVDLVPLLEWIRPDEVHLTLPSRPVPADWSIGSRGSHGSFAAERAFAMTAPEEVERIASILRSRAGVSVRTPPPPRQKENVDE